MNVEQEVSDLKEDVTDLKHQVKDLFYWRDVLNRDIQDLKSTFNKFDDKLDRTLDRQIQIVQDASARVPKWAMWMFGVLGGGVVIVAAGWVINALILHN